MPIIKIIGKNKFYNFSLGSANLDYIKIHLEYILKQNYKIENELNIKTGVLNYINIDRWISEDHINYVKNEPAFQKILKPKYRFITKNKVRHNLSIINKLCYDNNINLIIFTTPHHKLMMDQFDTESYLYFLKVISEFNNFYNFCGYNTITTNNNYYHPKVAKIFNDNSIYVPNDFGFYVTKKNTARLTVLTLLKTAIRLPTQFVTYIVSVL